MEFEIGQIFVSAYPPEAASWCNDRGDCYITEIDASDDGQRRFQIVAIPEPTEEEKAEMALAEAKRERAEEVAAIVVEIDGMKFQGDETSQNRMARVVNGAVALGYNLDEKTWMWILADNTIAHPTIRQLARALEAAGEAQTAVWADPYTNTESSGSQVSLAKVGI